jgi:hypothetical protein
VPAAPDAPEPPVGPKPALPPEPPPADQVPATLVAPPLPLVLPAAPLRAPTPLVPFQPPTPLLLAARPALIPPSPPAPGRLANGPLVPAAPRGTGLLTGLDGAQPAELILQLWSQRTVPLVPFDNMSHVICGTAHSDSVAGQSHSSNGSCTPFPHFDGHNGPTHSGTGLPLSRQ